MPETSVVVPRLQVVDASVSYGGHRALAGCTLSCRPGEVVAVFGHNGAGKSTLLRAIMGQVPLTDGAVHVEGERLAHESVTRRALRGIALVPDVSRGGVFGDLSVESNVMLARHGMRTDGDPLADLVRLFPALGERRKVLVRNLSGGQRQMVAVGIALARSPRVLLLDEPSVGLAPLVVTQMMDAVRQIAATTGAGVVLVEQNIREACRVADRIVILKTGRVACELLPGDVAVNELWQWF